MSKSVNKTGISGSVFMITIITHLTNLYKTIYYNSNTNLLLLSSSAFK